MGRGPFFGVVERLVELAFFLFVVWVASRTAPVVWTSQVQLPTNQASLAGLWLGLYIGIGYLLVSFFWADEPMARANLGSDVALQWCFTPTQVRRRLQRWRKMLEREWAGADGGATEPAEIETVQNGPAARTMRQLVRESLWRDMAGLIPLYFVILTFGLWYAADQLSWNWLSIVVFGIPLYIGLPLLAAIADYLEDICHLRYLSLHQVGNMPSKVMPFLACMMTLLKLLAFIPASLLVLAALLYGSYECAIHPTTTGWRGVAVISVSVLSAAVMAAIGIAAIYRRWPAPAKEEDKGDRSE
jgi:hypothetical protein